MNTLGIHTFESFFPSYRAKYLETLQTERLSLNTSHSLFERYIRNRKQKTWVIMINGRDKS